NASPSRFEIGSYSARLLEGLGPWLPKSSRNRFAEYAFEPARYITEKLGWTPWSGTAAAPGQQQIIDAYTLALRQQHERAQYEAGLIGEQDLSVWAPGRVIQNRIRVEAGHSVGKTMVAAGL